MPFDPAAAGWEARRRNDFPDFNGPIWEKLENGARIFGFLADARHANDRGVVHGGMLMTFADHSLGELMLDAVERKLCATIQLNTHFLRAAQIGDFVECRGTITRQTGRMVFMHGYLSVNGANVAAVDGIWTILKNQPG
jgi:uncharacterized protein (TIGR00369 family)